MLSRKHCALPVAHLVVFTARKLLKSMSIKQGVQYDSPDSAGDIPGFIEFHKLNVDEMLHPVEWFSTWHFFNSLGITSHTNITHHPQKPSPQIHHCE